MTNIAAVLNAIYTTTVAVNELLQTAQMATALVQQAQAENRDITNEELSTFVQSRKESEVALDQILGIIR